MQFRIADTFTDSLAKLTGDEQKSVKTTAFDLQLNPANPGLQFHKLHRARDKNFWSVRVSRDIRLIVHKTDSSLLLCYVDHHDNAYDWAERRRLETHPKTGAAQLVEIRESVREIEIPKYVEVEKPAPPLPKLFDSNSNDELLNYGVPEEWLADVREANEESIFALIEHLPVEAGEALLALAVGESPVVLVQKSVTSPFEHPDAQRRFKLVTDSEELTLALDYPWDKWAVFLHPLQKVIVESNFNGPARVAGSAGTGKTIVALHRAAHLARKYPEARILVTTFSNTLAQVLQTKLNHLLATNETVLNRIVVSDLNSIGHQIHSEQLGPMQIAEGTVIRELLSANSQLEPDLTLSAQFIWIEWRDVVDAWQLTDWDSYRNVPRLGRKTRLGERQRQSLWTVFQKTREELINRGLTTQPMMFGRVAEWLNAGNKPPFEIAIVDEAQDLSVSQLRFLAALGQSHPESLFFAGDLGQRIFEPPFSWKTLGVDVRGRSKTLRINYRTSHQIRMQADKLLPPELADVDGNSEKRSGTVSVFNGPAPDISIFDSVEDESKAIAGWINENLAAGICPDEIGVFVRSEHQFPRAQSAIESAGAKCNTIHDSVDIQPGQVTLMTMHKAKGMEFRVVAVMACDDEVIPLQERIESVADDSDLKEVYETERHLLYVACTRARDQLLVTGVDPASEFLDDLIQN